MESYAPPRTRSNKAIKMLLFETNVSQRNTKTPRR